MTRATLDTSTHCQSEEGCAVVFKLSYVEKAQRVLCVFHKRQYERAGKPAREGDLKCPRCSRTWELRRTRNGKVPSSILHRTQQEFKRHVETCAAREIAEREAGVNSTDVTIPLQQRILTEPAPSSLVEMASIQYHVASSSHDEDDDMTVVSTEGTSAIAISTKALDVIFQAIREQREGVGSLNQGLSTLLGDINNARPYKGDRRMLIVRPETFGSLRSLTNQNLSKHKGLLTVASKLDSLADALIKPDTGAPTSATIENTESGEGESRVTTVEEPTTEVVVPGAADANGPNATPAAETSEPGAQPGETDDDGEGEEEGEGKPGEGGEARVHRERRQIRRRGDGVYQRRHSYVRTTGAEVAVFDTWHPESTYEKGKTNEERYVVADLTHNAQTRIGNVRAASHGIMRHPEEFCQTCKDVVSKPAKERREIKRQIKGPEPLPEGVQRVGDVVEETPFEVQPTAQAEAATATAERAEPHGDEAQPIMHPSDENAPATAWEAFRDSKMKEVAGLTDVAWNGDKQFSYVYANDKRVDVFVQSDGTEVLRVKSKSYDSLDEAKKAAGVK